MPATPTFDLPSDIPNVAPPVPRPVKASGAASRSAMPPARSVASASAYKEPPTPAPVAASPARSYPVRPDFRMIVLNSGRVLEFPDQENVIIGRSDAASGDQPDIDLTPDNGHELGVSRRHACVTFRDNQPYLTDLGSTNRTFLNRQMIMRGQPYEIQDGDEVRLGNVIVKIIYNPGGM